MYEALSYWCICEFRVLHRRKDAGNYSRRAQLVAYNIAAAAKTQRRHVAPYAALLLYMCPHTTVYVSSYYCICVLILLYVSSVLPQQPKRNIAMLPLHPPISGMTVAVPGAHFTCFTSIKVQILTLPLHPPFSGMTAAVPGAHFTCFTSIKVQILTPEELRARHAPRHTRLWWLSKYGVAWGSGWEVALRAGNGGINHHMNNDAFTCPDTWASCFYAS